MSELAKLEKQLDILVEIQHERSKQDAKWGEQNHPFVITDGIPEVINDFLEGARISRLRCDEMFAQGVGTWGDILNEEVHEAFAEAAQGNMKAFREELIQVAAVVVAMIECVDRKEKP